MSKKKILHPDNPNGIYRYDFPVINGIKQYIQIRGTDKTKPVLLFLHGGPGGSVAGVCRAIQEGWENSFTVVNWDQRNTCKTYFANKSAAQAVAQSGSLSDYINDIDGVISYLHTVCEFEKLILVGFSWGSIIGAEYAKAHPEKLLCYIGIGQIVSVFDGMDFICEKIGGLAAESPRDMAMLKKITDTPKETFMSRELMNAIRDLSMLSIKYIIRNTKPYPVSELTHSPFMNFRERRSVISSDYKLFAGSHVTMLKYNFREKPCFEVPVLFVYGDEDCSSPPKLMEDCFDKVSASKKKLEIIPRAGHNCFYDKSERFIKILNGFLGDLS